MKEDFIEENDLRMSKDRTILYGYSGEGGTRLDVPASIVEIAPRAFEGISSLQEVSLNEGLQCIGDYAFACTSIAKVRLPSTVKELGVCCFTVDDLFIDYFEPCHYAKMEVDKDSNHLRSDGQCIYKRREDNTEELLLCYNSQIATYEVSDNTVCIRKYAFLGCSKLKDIKLGTGVKWIEENVFRDCGLERLYIPANVQELSNVPFLTYWTKSGERYRISLHIDPENPYYFNVGWVIYKRENDGDTLLSCSSNETIITVQDGTTTIGEQAFAECSELEKVLLPNTVKTIKRGAFRLCESLNTIIALDDPRSDWQGLALPSSIETVEEYAFSGCNMKDV
ncbi:MAG: leucine-rich repeat domain-containing protein [bacterium]|nr:leucine-rich repeat domain-containing protein [bacterium]